MFQHYIRHRQCNSYESLQLLNVPVTLYSIHYIALENNALHKFTVNKINRHNRYTDDDGCTIKTCLLKLKKSHYFLKFLRFCCCLNHYEKQH